MAWTVLPRKAMAARSRKSRCDQIGHGPARGEVADGGVDRVAEEGEVGRG